MKIWFAFLLMTCVASPSQGEEKVNVPKGVNYKAVSRKLNEEARDKIQKVFRPSPAETDEHTLLGQYLICGPPLWDLIKTDSRLAHITNGVMKIKMPIVRRGKLVSTQEAEGKLFQGKEEVRAFWVVMRTKYQFVDPQIRKPTALELRIFWAMIPFDAIEEPVFVVETQACKLFVKLSKSKLALFWIDDYMNVSFQEDDVPKKS